MWAHRAAAAGAVFLTACSSAPGNTGSPGHEGGNPYQFPVSIEGRSIVDAAGRVVVLNGDTPWSLPTQLDSGEVLDYLDTRVSQGVNALIFNLVEHQYAVDAPSNTYGQRPFLSSLEDGMSDFTALDPDYWSYVEWIVTQARDRGMVCLVVPAYMGYEFNPSGWSQEIRANGPERMAAYGDSLARRFGAYGNIIWVMGGDWTAAFRGVDLRPEVRALVSGIEATMPEALFTAHSRRHRSSLDSYGEAWLDINATYSDTAQGAARLLLDQRRTFGESGPAMPTIWFEGFYENEHDMTAEQVRSQMYLALLSGAAGHFYGAHPVWSLGAPSAQWYGDSDRAPFGSWFEALRAEGADDLVHTRWLIDNYPVHLLEPDTTLGVWSRPGTNAGLAVARVADGSLTMAYARSGAPVELDLSSFAGAPVSVSWLDPRTGDVHPEAEAVVSIAAPLEPPSEGDWLLIVEAR